MAHEDSIVVMAHKDSIVVIAQKCSYAPRSCLILATLIVLIHTQWTQCFSRHNVSVGAVL